MPPQDAIDFLAELSGFSPIPGDRRQRAPLRQDPQWPALWRYLVERRGLADALVELCRDFGLVHADRHGNPVFARRNAAGVAVDTETRNAAPDAHGGFWMSWEPDWPRAVILADNALDVLSILSLHLVPAIRRGCAVVSTGTVTSSIPEWIQAWNPERIFCAYSDARNGDHAAQRLKDKDTRIVRLRPALDGQDWNDMLIRDRAGEPLQTDDRPIG